MGELIQGAMKILCLPQAELAPRMGVPYDTVRGWSSRRAEPSPDNRAALAAFMRKHAAELVKLAEELET